MTPPHPKHTWRAFLNDFLRTCVYLAGIAGVLGGLWVLELLLSSHSYPKREIARLDVQNIQHALRLHSVRTGRYPTEAEGLKVLVGSGALERMPFDPWGNPYNYALPEGHPVVWSLGADGTSGGEGEDADVISARAQD